MARLFEPERSLADLADVMNAVCLARRNGLLVSIRGGGHNAAELGMCDDGLVIDLSRIRYTHVDPKAGAVRAGADAHGPMWIMLRTRLAWRFRPGLSLRPE